MKNHPAGSLSPLKLLSATLLAVFLTATGGAEDESAADKPYNVLFISIDDLRTELGCYGVEHIKTPNIDRLAQTGVLFSNAHVQQAICMASRASIMSGIRPERRGIYTGESVQKVMPDILTLNKFFQANGYNISSGGKIYHFPEDTKNQFGESYLNPEKTWIGRGYVTQESAKARKANAEREVGPAFEAAPVEDTAYPDGANTVAVINELKKLKEDGKPFFMAYGILKPHLPFCAPQKYWDLYPEKSVTLAEIRKHPENTGKHTMRVAGEFGNYAGMPHQFADIDESMELTLRRAYYACVSYADAQVGKVLQQLDELGLRENTVVVLWGDHGFKIGEYGSWSKWSNMNIDTQIPLIFRVPGGKEGETCHRMVEALDIYPTLAEVCQLKQPSHLEGTSLKPLLSDPTARIAKKDYAFTMWPHHRWIYKKTIMGYSVKDERFNYVEWVKLDSGKVLARELYDQSKDPDETVNVIAESEYAEAVTRLAAQCQLRKNDTDHDHKFKNLR